MSLRLFLSALVALAFVGLAVGQGKDAARAESDLKSVRGQIRDITRQMAKDAAARDKLAKDLRAAEGDVVDVRERLNTLRGERKERATRRAELARQKAERERALAEERGALGEQLRAAYVIGREEPLKLLLNQQDPARAGRMFAYYSYFGRARAEHIAGIELRVSEIQTLDAELESEDQELAALENRQRSELQRLEVARKQRGRVLANLEQESKSRAATLDRLKKEQAGLEKLIRELRRALEKYPPVDSKDAFAKLRGKLAWPTSGKIVASFGQTRAGGIKWDGVLLATQRGAPVRSVYQGRIAYADWLPGLGLLVVVDHGGGYLSLYAHNERLFKAVGERVTAGDTIASAGDTGGRSRPELYFEIRRGGKPVDPRLWFSRQAPPP